MAKQTKTLKTVVNAQFPLKYYANLIHENDFHSPGTFIRGFNKRKYCEALSVEKERGNDYRTTLTPEVRL